ncbi:hypothetical protein GCM10011584_09480 [Nocardioides phosphati]|uniref:Uncharacterized protein n=1 Tax=Nocardioides phosphati TaxID=1867775 RepID=A0ABQ2N6T3_9ACTN|nr:hypothetical protein [Nocardioides phosphati]GGO86652.1 hypothetical protein GCM10011584_09480 [Nocardioides phosphati]
MATVFPSATERARIEAELIETAHYAARQQRVIGTSAYPSKWDDAHHLLDDLLDDWLAARG